MGSAERADLGKLLEHLDRRPSLERDAELALTRRARKDQKARGLLVEHHLRLAISIALKFRGRGLPLEDLVQEGCCGLMKASERFDPERGYRFSTYAMWWIQAYIRRALRDGFSSVRRVQGEGPIPPDVSLDGNADEGDGSLMECLAADEPGAEDRFAWSERDEQVRDALGRVKKRLGGLAWDIIHRRLAQDDPQTLSEIGAQWNLSRERVRQVEASTRAFLAGYLPQQVDLERAA
jgi:RNA polymerase primary sigma factor